MNSKHQNEYLNTSCIYCKKNKLTFLNTVPKGKRKYTNQQYIKCANCKKTMMCFKEKIKEI